VTAAVVVDVIITVTLLLLVLLLLVTAAVVVDVIITVSMKKIILTVRTASIIAATVVAATIGFWGLNDSMTTGIGTGRFLLVLSRQGLLIPNTIQTAASLNPGNSRS
jgi:S1-C subfamily serine protease